MGCPRATARRSRSRSSAHTACAACRTRCRARPAPRMRSLAERSIYRDPHASEGHRMNSGLVVGIDAGATKTRAFAVDRGGEVVGRGAGGGANLLASSDPQGSIAAALKEALGGRDADAIVLSAAGADRKADRERGRDLLARVSPA